MTERLITFTLDGHLYGVDVDHVQEVLRSQPRTRIPLAPPAIAGLVNLRGQVLCAVELRARLGWPPRPADADEMLIVVRVAGEAVALVVDSIGAVVDVAPENCEMPPDTLAAPGREFLRGVHKLDHGLLLALDVSRVVTG